MIELFRIGLALLGLWLQAVWSVLGFWGQAALMAVLFGLFWWSIVVLFQSMSDWKASTRVEAEAERAIILRRAKEDALQWGMYCWQSYEQRKEEET